MFITERRVREGWMVRGPGEPREGAPASAARNRPLQV